MELGQCARVWLLLGVTHSDVRLVTVYILCIVHHAFSGQRNCDVAVAALSHLRWCNSSLHVRGQLHCCMGHMLPILV